MPEVTPDEWDKFLAQSADAHILQTRAWGDLKSGFGWKARYLVAFALPGSKTAGCQLLFRKLPFGLSLAYIAKGPVGLDAGPGDSGVWQALLPEIDQMCRSEHAVFLKVEPDLWAKSAETNGTESVRQNPPAGFRESPHMIQPRRTLVVDIRGSEAQVLARMKQKTRYNIRLAQKKGVVVYAGQDIEAFHRLLILTGKRDVFGVHSREYYQRAYDLFAPGGNCALLFSEFEGDLLAGLMVFRRGSRAWYFYGASSNLHRERMPTYLLQWEAIRWAKAHGCTTYDLWGVPDEDESVLEAEFSNRSDGLWGVYRFKRGFGGCLMRSVGPWDRIYLPLLYSAYSRWSRLRG